MNIRKATLEDQTTVQEIVHRTIQTIYPNYYPAEVVNFFLEHHCLQHINKDIALGNVYLLLDEGIAAGTGSISDDNTIGRLYVLPEHQGKGYGSILMNTLENLITDTGKTSCIEASLPSYDYYLNRGYIPKEYRKHEVENHRILCYYTMEKSLTSGK